MKQRFPLLVFMVVMFFSCQNGTVKEEKEKEEFEGRITYLIHLKSKSKAYSTEDLQGYFGDTMVFYYKAGKSRMSYNGIDIRDIYYLPEPNMEYTLRRAIDTLFANSCREDRSKLIGSYPGEETEAILGRECKKLTNHVGEVKYHYWFDPNLHVHPDHFKNRGFGYVNVYYEHSEAMWLRFFHEGENYDLVYEAFKIEEMVLADSIFKLPDLPRKELK